MSHISRLIDSIFTFFVKTICDLGINFFRGSFSNVVSVFRTGCHNHRQILRFSLMKMLRYERGSFFGRFMILLRRSMTLRLIERKSEFFSKRLYSYVQLFINRFKILRHKFEDSRSCCQ